MKFDLVGLLNAVDWTSIGYVILKIILIYIGYRIIKAIGGKLIDRSFEKVMNRDDISEGRAKTLKSLTKNIFSYVLSFILIVTVLPIFNIDATALLAGAGVVGLAIGFGAQGLVSDVVTGFFLLLEKQLDVDDYVTTGSFSGIVESIGLKTTTIRGFDGTLHYIPNRQINTLSNHSRGNMRALVDIGISYDDNIDHAIEVLQTACDEFAKNEPAVKEGPNVIGVQTFGASDVVIRVIAKTENMQQWAVERNLRKKLKDTLDQNGIEIPYPHQVLVTKNQGDQNIEKQFGLQ